MPSLASQILGRNISQQLSSVLQFGTEPAQPLLFSCGSFSQQYIAMPSDLGAKGKSQSCSYSSSGAPVGPKKPCLVHLRIVNHWMQWFFLLVGKDPVAFKGKLVPAFLVWLWWAMQQDCPVFCRDIPLVHTWASGTTAPTTIHQQARILAFREAERCFCVDLSGAGVGLYFLDKTGKCSFCLLPLHTHIFFSL